MTTFETKIIRKAAIAEQSLNDRHAFLDRYHEYFPRVYNYVRYRCGDQSITDDITSIVFEKALTKFHQYSPKRGSFGAWLFAIARNEVNAYLRSLLGRNRIVPMEQVQDWPTGKLSPEEALIDGELRNELIAALEGLNERERDLVGLKFSARFTNRQISAMTGLTENNVGIILYRALQKLRRQLTPQTEQK